MRRILLFSALVTVSFAHIIDLEVFYKERDDVLLQKVSRVAKRVNAANQFIEAKFDEINCAEVEISDHDKKIREICDELQDSVAIVVRDRDFPNAKVMRVVSASDYKDVTQLTVKLLAEFSFSMFNARAEEHDTHSWWSSLSETLENQKQEKLLKTQSELDEFLGEESEKQNFVLFYKPDSFSNFAALVYSLEASGATSTRLRIVDCSVTEDLCDSIEEFPALYSFLDNKKYSLFEGNYSLEEIRDWMKKLLRPAMLLLTEDVVPKYRSGIVPGFDEIQDTVTMLFVPTKKSPVYKYYKKFAMESHGKYHLTVFVDKGIEKWANQPAFITMKPREKIQQAFVLYKDLNREKMLDFIEGGIQPSIHHLSDARSTLVSLNLKLPLFVFFDPENVKNSSDFEKLASEHEIRTTASAFAMVKGLNLFGLFLHNLLGETDLRPSYILIDAEKGCLRRKLISAENKDELLHWIKSQKEETCDRELKLDSDVLQRLDHWDQRTLLKKQLLEKSETKIHDEL